MKPFADLLQEYFEEAAQCSGVLSESIQVDGREIAFHFAGDRWVHLMDAMAHLRGDADAPSLRVHVWDGERQPRNHVLRAYLYTLSNWWFDYVGPRGQLLDVHSARLPAIYVPGPDLLYVTDLERNTAYCWKRQPDALPYWETCSPFRPLLHSWLREEGLQLVHAAGVGSTDGGALLCGPGGSGKSSSALACLDSPLGYLSDDYCIMKRDLEQSGFTAHSLYSTAKLVAEEDLRRFPALAPHVWNPDREKGDKAAFFLHERAAAKLVRRFPLRVLLLPTVTGLSDTAVEPCRAVDAMKALAPSTLSQLPDSNGRDLAFLREAAQSVPAYRLKLGTDIAQIAPAIAGVIEREAARAR